MSWMERIAAICGVIVALPATWLVIRGWMRAVAARIERDRVLTEIARHSKQILDQLHPNGGNSIKDNLTEITHRLIAGEERFKDHDRRLVELKGRVDRFEVCPECNRLREVTEEVKP